MSGDKKLAEEIIAKIPKGLYADVRIVEKDAEGIATKDGVVEALESSNSKGYGIRILKDGAWGFAGSNDFSKAAIDKTVKRAIEIAASSASYNGEEDKTGLDQLKPVRATYKTPIKEDPFKVSLNEKMELLLEADKKQRVNSKIAISQTSYSAHRELKTFASTIGSLIEQEIIYTGAGIEASAAEGQDFQNRRV